MHHSIRSISFVIPSIQVSALVLALAGPFQTVSAAIYDAAADFSLVSNPNPNGVWSEGGAATLGGLFQAFDKPTANYNNLSLSAWEISNLLGSPLFLKNVGATPLFGLLPGRVALHPGGLEYAILRFTAPEDGFAQITAQFFAGDSGNTNAAIVLNGNGAFPLFSVASTTSNPSYLDQIALSAGDTLDFAVGLGGDGFTADTTPLNVAINFVPEPTTLALVLGSLAIVSSRRRKSA